MDVHHVSVHLEGDETLRIDALLDGDSESFTLTPEGVDLRIMLLERDTQRTLLREAAHQIDHARCMDSWRSGTTNATVRQLEVYCHEIGLTHISIP